jgi:hypothetical protein
MTTSINSQGLDHQADNAGVVFLGYRDANAALDAIQGHVDDKDGLHGLS